MNLTATITSQRQLHYASSDARKEGHVFDRDRFLAADHQARLHAEADARRRARTASTAPRPVPRPGHGRGLRHTFGHWLVTTGSRLAPDPDPCGPARPRTA